MYGQHTVQVAYWQLVMTEKAGRERGLSVQVAYVQYVMWRMAPETSH
jgi:hypothetical protein